MDSIHFIIPGPLEQLTGGYLYDQHIIEGLRALGKNVVVHSLDGEFPLVDAVALESGAKALAQIPSGAKVVIDGLAMPGLVPYLEEHSSRLKLCALIHHPLAAETGLNAQQREKLRQWEYTALSLVKQVIVTSEFTAGILSSYDVGAEHIGVVVPGVSPMPSAQGSDKDTIQLLCVASLIPRKGHLILCRALALLSDLDWQLYCIGSLKRHPATVAKVKQYIAANVLQQRITLCGELPYTKVCDAYCSADAFALASFYEGYGMVLAEAIASGLPIVSTTGGAITHTVPSQVGILVEPGNVDALATALRCVISDKEQRSKMKQEAQKVRASLPTWQIAVKLFAQELDKLDGQQQSMRGFLSKFCSF